MKSGYMTDTVPDPSRQVRNTIGYVISRYTTVRRTSGTTAFLTQRTQADLLLSIRQENIPDTKSGDRVHVHSGVHSGDYDISFIEFWGNGRTVLHLLKRH